MKPCSETLRHVNDYLTNVVRGEKGLQFTSLTHGLCQINISSFKHLTKKTRREEKRYIYQAKS